MADVSNTEKEVKNTRLLDENDVQPLSTSAILDVMEGDGDSNMSDDDLPEDYEGDISDEDIWAMLGDDD
jgi:hypothetical protein